MENEKIAELLHDLAAINFDRANAYEEASFQNQLFDVELRTTFALLANQSRQNMYMLSLHLEKLLAKGAAPRPGHGPLYQEWKNCTGFYLGENRRSMLTSCEAGEQAVIGIYEHAIASPARTELRESLEKQLRGLENSLTTVTKMLQVTGSRTKGVI